MTRRRTVTDVDREALERALTIDRAREDACRRQIDGKLASGEPWSEVARFAAQRCQEISLQLKPWECWPPCVVDVNDVDEPGLEHRSIAQSAALLRRLLAANLSRYEPDPLNALARVEAAEPTA